VSERHGFALWLGVALLGASCALFEANTPAEVAVAGIRDMKTAHEAAARGCALYRAGVALGEVPPDPVVTAACDEAFPVGSKP
jgi:uncharacterized lipoprotein YbaY